MVKGFTSRMAVGVLALMAAGAAWAEDAPPRKEFNSPALNARWNVRAGGLLTSFDTSAAWAPEGTAGALIQLESDLGLEEHVDAVLLGATYRMGPRHSFVLSFNSISRDSIRATQRDIEFGDLEFQAGAEIETIFDVDEAQLYWRYDFSDSERLNAGVSAGFSTLLIDLALEGEAQLEGGGSVARREEGSDFVAPIPLVGFFVEYAFSPRWVLRTQMNTIRVDVSDTFARVLQTGVTAEFYPTKIFGIGLGAGSSDIEYNSIEEDEKLAARYRVDAVLGYVNFAF